jgi:hypothetical protein
VAIRFGFGTNYSYEVHVLLNWLKSRNWKVNSLLVGQTLSVLGNEITEKGLPLVLIAMTGESTLAGDVTGLASILSMFVIPFLGAMAEKSQPRSLVGLNGLFALISVVLIVGVQTKSTGLITLALFLGSTVGGVFDSLYNKCLRNFVRSGESEKTAKIQSVFSRLATAGGAGLAQPLTVMFGGFAFAVDAGSFVLSALIALTLPKRFSDALPVSEASAIVSTPRSRGNAMARVKKTWLEIVQGFVAADKALVVVLMSAFAIWQCEALVLANAQGLKPFVSYLFVVKSATEVGTASLLLALGWKFTNRVLAVAATTLAVSGVLMASAATPGLWGNSLTPLVDVVLHIVGFGSWATDWHFQVPVVATVAMILSGIGSNIFGAGVHQRLYYGGDAATVARVASLVTVAQKAAGFAFAISLTRVADKVSPSVAYVIAGTLLFVTTLVVFGIFKPAMANDDANDSAE